MAMTEAFIAEMDQESEATRRMLEVVPADRLDWKPHEKSMSLGQLAIHVATIPGGVAELLKMETMHTGDFEGPSLPGSTEEILEALDESLGKARDILGSMDDEAMMGTFRLMKGEQEVMSMPKVGLARAIILNHLYHHRGQLSVYLRLLDVPLPSVYGPTADENPFTA
jgi:uncharacterized damage-inducible protein DinB